MKLGDNVFFIVEYAKSSIKKICDVCEGTGLLFSKSNKPVHCFSCNGKTVNGKAVNGFSRQIKAYRIVSGKIIEKEGETYVLRGYKRHSGLYKHPPQFYLHCSWLGNDKLQNYWFYETELFTAKQSAVDFIAEHLCKDDVLKAGEIEEEVKFPTYYRLTGEQLKKKEQQ